MIKLEITASNITELHNQIIQLASDLGAKETTQVQIDLPLKAVLPTEVEDVPKEKKTRARKDKAEGNASNGGAASVEVPSSAGESVAPATPQTAASHTLGKDDVMGALQGVSAKHGLQKARDMVGLFKKPDGSACAKISDLQLTDYQAFINACKKES